MFISSAYANASAAAASPDWTSFLPLIIIFVLFWFMLIRPQMKQAKQHRAMVAALQKGDEVTVAGGIVGRITKVSDDFVDVEIALKSTFMCKNIPYRRCCPRARSRHCKHRPSGLNHTSVIQSLSPIEFTRAAS